MAKTRSAQEPRSASQPDKRKANTLASRGQQPLRKSVRGDLQSKWVIVLKAGLFLVLGCLSGGLLLSTIVTLRNMALLALTIWSFCRCYYFVFYVIEHYVDSSYRYRGLIDLVKHYWKRST
ncbi:hypothetical protein [Allorhodopirellula heiligendammensis]|uniref:Uncharacterized protein n=1 Tax=Allorhodopirellula heiligendammensis TaxID=2714739 RepID=A0A5C6C6F9_9BACT|nr:hypothetical protein [Allorhodopirellula heiligendammensis]TWU18369.1 hypothetical protein Poly21_05310 [Allorhodopirellula heiligendammensis]